MTENETIEQRIARETAALDRRIGQAVDRVVACQRPWCKVFMPTGSGLDDDRSPRVCKKPLPCPLHVDPLSPPTRRPRARIYKVGDKWALTMTWPASFSSPPCRQLLLCETWQDAVKLLP